MNERTGSHTSAAADAGVILALDVLREADVFSARQYARDVAAAVGLNRQDQIRLATALSEVGRDVLTADGGRLAFRLTADPALTATVVTRGVYPPADALPAAEVGLDAARRLVDEVAVDPREDGRAAITLLKRLAPGLGYETMTADLRRKLAASAPGTPLDELRAQNEDLLATLEQLQGKQDELVQLNAELEETNRGVMALYGQLSEELEKTNRGVVALYAELDEKGIELERANEAKTRFLRNVSHELRTPVNSILGLSRLLLDPHGDPLSEEQRRQVDLIHSSGSDLLSLVNELLDLARAESGQVPTVLGDVDVSGVAEAARAMIAPLVRSGVSLVTDVPDDLPRLRTDESLVRHVLRNLLSNAAKFTQQGEIRLACSLAPSGRQVVLSVSDTGIGISAEDQKHLFEEFFQARNPLQSETKGTGLGLPLARRFVTQLGGELSVRSEVGVGSTFLVRLPLSTDERDERMVTA